MLVFDTYYKAGSENPYSRDESRFYSYVLAHSKEQALEILEKRKSGEGLNSTEKEPMTGDTLKRFKRLPRVSSQYKERKLHKCLHSLVFLGNFLIRAEKISIDDLLNDNGLIHSVIHEIMERKWLSKMRSESFDLGSYEPKVKFSEKLYAKMLDFDKIVEELGW